MQCPTDGATLLMTERSGIEIDYCPDCRGVWLDRGELDKLIERASDSNDRAGRPDRTDRDHERRSDREKYEPRYGYDAKPYKRKKKSSFLSEIFEFGD